MEEIGEARTFEELEADFSAILDDEARKAALTEDDLEALFDEVHDVATLAEDQESVKKPLDTGFFFFDMLAQDRPEISGKCELIKMEILRLKNELLPHVMRELKELKNLSDKKDE